MLLQKTQFERIKKLESLRTYKHPRKDLDKTYKVTLKHNLFRRERLIRKTIYFYEYRITIMIVSEANNSYISENVIKKYKIRL